MGRYSPTDGSALGRARALSTVARHVHVAGSAPGASHQPARVVEYHIPPVPRDGSRHRETRARAATVAQSHPRIVGSWLA
eukprot:4839044-Pleurochrysis_carterae.AAC.4